MRGNSARGRSPLEPFCSSFFQKLEGLCFFCIALFSISAQTSGKTPPILPAGDYVWFPTKHGLYRYNGTQNEWNAFSSGNGLASNDVRDIGIEEGIIWVATDGGVSNSDVRFSDWRSYTTNNGLPSNDIKCVAFSKDYVWIGTVGGAARYDKTLEDWKSYTTADGLAGDQVNDIAVDGETVWFATSNGVSEFDINFNKWTNYTLDSGLPSINVITTVVVGEYIWFITDKGPARYDRRMRSWKSYSLADGIVSYLVNNVVIDGKSIWLATREGVSIYDPVSDSWSEGIVYHTGLPDKNVMDLAADGDVIWFCTDKGVSSFDGKSGNWRHYTSADGLLDNLCQRVAVSGLVFVMTEKGINLYDKKTQEWDVYEFPGEGKVGRGRRERMLRIDERGIGFDISPEAQMRLSGFNSLEFSDVSDFEPERRDEYEWRTKNDLSLRGTMPGRRSLVGFYNNVKEDNVEYGLTYRGNDTDLLQEATGGEFDVRMRNSELIQDMNLIGAGARLTQRLGRAKLHVEPRYGDQRGYFETDFFTYKTGTTIYQLSHTDIIPESDTVIVDKEMFQRGVDYLIVYPSGWLMFHREELIEEGGEIEVRYQYEPAEKEDNRLAILTTGFDLSDNYYTGLDMVHGDKMDVISLNGEGKDIGTGSISMKLKPEIAYSRQQSGDQILDGVASRAEIIANIPRTQFKFDYEGYGEDFWTTGKRETKFGELERHFGVFSRADITRWMPLTMRWQQDRSRKEGADDVLEEDARINIVLSKRPYPTIALTGQRNAISTSSQSDQTKNAIRADFQYDLPESLLSFIKFRKAGVKSYYKEAYRSSSAGVEVRTQTGYAKLMLYPVEKFDLSASYKLNRAKERQELREELQQLLFRSNFASIKGIMANLRLDDLRSRQRSAEGSLIEDKNRYFASSLNLIPGAWIRKLGMLTVAGRYNFLQQTVPVEDDQRADSNSRALWLQTNLRPHNTVSCTGTYERVKSWQGQAHRLPSGDITPIKNNIKYSGEAEFKPGSKSRIMLEYSQEYEDEDSVFQKRKSLYSPSLWWETRWTGKWTTRLRSLYQRYNVQEKGQTSEEGSTLTPSLSFRYTNRKLPYNGRIYLTQAFSVSVDRSQRGAKELASETYSASFGTEWKMTNNLSFRLRASLSYKDDHTESDEGSTSIYTWLVARF